MPDTINWLHFTDLHFGLDSRSWFWPNLKHKLFRDIAHLTRIAGKWDLVFFTGDLTQCAEKDQFEQLENTLGELWGHLSTGDSAPLLCVVPGNHDLVRPPEQSSICKAMTQLWWQDESIRKSFWEDESSEYRQAVYGFFENYSEWQKNTGIPLLSEMNGERFVKDEKYPHPLAYHDLRYRRDKAPLLDSAAAVIDHAEAYSLGGAHDDSNFVTACNKCNAQKSNRTAEDHLHDNPSKQVKGRYGEPTHWDGLVSLFMVLASKNVGGLTASERGWYRAFEEHFAAGSSRLDDGPTE